MNKKERFCRAYGYLRSVGKIHRQEDLAMAMKASRSNISSALAGRETVLTDKFLQRFAASYPSVFNLEWLLTGEGDMLQAPQMAQDGFLQVMANDTKLYTQESRDGQISRLLDMIDERDAKIEALLKENAGLRAELASAGIYGKKHG